MNAIKINEIINSDNLIIKGLNKYKGRKVEIILLVDDKDSDIWPKDYFNKTYGFMKNNQIVRGSREFERVKNLVLEDWEI